MSQISNTTAEYAKEAGDADTVDGANNGEVDAATLSGTAAADLTVSHADTATSADTATDADTIDGHQAADLQTPAATQSRKLAGGYTVSKEGLIDSGNTITIQFDHYLDGVSVTGDRAYNWTVVDELGNTVLTLSSGRFETVEATFEGQVIDYVTLENTTGYSDQDWSMKGHTPALPDHSHQI